MKEAIPNGVDNYHGVKIYMDLTTEQRLDVQLISNTNIATSSDLFDRMQETYKGPQLRAWCQAVGLLGINEDFADRLGRGGAITVRMARTFITNFIDGRNIDVSKFDVSDTSPSISVSGQLDEDWDTLRDRLPGLWDNEGLFTAGRQFARLVTAQRAAFAGSKPRAAVDRPEKAMNAAVLAAWAYVSGVLQSNSVRLERHYAIADTAGRDPLNAADLARAKHRTDPDNYRGLGFRTDAKERGRLTELFFAQAETGSGISKRLIDLAVAKYHAKQSVLEVARLEARA